MATAEQRLHKVEGALSPRQVVLAWLAEAQQRLNGLEELDAEVRAHPERSLPLDTIFARVQANVGAAHGPRQTWDTQSAVATAMREAASLFYLAMEVNLQIGSQERVQELGRCCADIALEWLRVQGTPAADYDYWVRFVEDLLRERYALRAAVAQIIARSFPGGSPLFPTEAATLNAWITDAEGLARDYEALRAGSKPRGRNRLYRIDCAAIREEANGEPAQAVVEAIRTTARERTRLLTGDHLRDRATPPRYWEQRHAD